MQKEFDLKTFKKAASNVSGFLKDKNVDISHVTLYNALSLFLGYKNWNTLNNTLSKPAASETEIISTNEMSVNACGVNLMFKDRVLSFVDFFQNFYNAEYSSNIILTGKDMFPYRIKVENILEAARKISDNYNSNLDIHEISTGKYESKCRFDCNDSMSDEKRFSIKIAQKGMALFPYMDVLLYVFATENKWFENYIMGECKYSYVYDKTYQKQVITINLPIDNFMVKDFNEQIIKLELFLNHFLSSKIRLDVENSDMECGMVVQQASNIGGFAAGAISGSGISVKSFNGSPGRANRGR